MSAVDLKPRRGLYCVGRRRRLLFEGDYTRIDVFPDGERFLAMRRVPEPGAGGPLRIEVRAARAR